MTDRPPYADLELHVPEPEPEVRLNRFGCVILTGYLLALVAVAGMIALLVTM